MNRKKKIKTILMAKKKKANKKQQTSNKPKYISKAERARLEQQSQHPEQETQDATPAATEKPD